MTQNPFAHPADYPAVADQAPQPTRTSVAAILSLVSSIICCIPGLGLIGVILGIASLMFIAGAQGRLSGKGLAWTGILVGALVTALQIGGLLGIMSFSKAWLTQTGAIITAIDQQDYTKARTEMGPNATGITDAEFDAFRSAYQAELGSPKFTPRTMGEWFGAFAKAGKAGQQQPQQPMGGAMPVPIEFDHGYGLFVLEMSPGSQHSSPMKLPIGNIVIVTPSGKHISLTGSSFIPPTVPKPPPQPAPPPGGAPPGGGGGGGGG